MLNTKIIFTWYKYSSVEEEIIQAYCQQPMSTIHFTSWTFYSLTSPVNALNIKPCTDDLSLQKWSQIFTNWSFSWSNLVRAITLNSSPFGYHLWQQLMCSLYAENIAFKVNGFAEKSMAKNHKLSCLQSLFLPLELAPSPWARFGYAHSAQQLVDLAQGIVLYLDKMSGDVQESASLQSSFSNYDDAVSDLLRTQFCISCDSVSFSSFLKMLWPCFQSW